VSAVPRHALFDGEDVDLGEEAPDGREMTADELAVMQAAMAEPSSPKAGIGAS
jgi:hypothetical protein